MSDILVYAQITDGEIHDTSLQCLAKARELAASAGGQVACLALGSGLGETVAALFGYGADAVYAADHADLANYLTGPYKKVTKAFLAQNSFGLFLLPATTCGDDLAPMIAAELGLACVVDADTIRIDGGAVVPGRHEFDRKVVSEYAAQGEGMLVVTLKDGIAEAGEPDAARTGEITAVDVALDESDKRAKVLSRDVVPKTVNLKEAKIIVGAGAGVGTQENFQKIRELADALEAEIGATRAVVDAGWLPADHQIGQTGATVRPDVYIACGISGAVQHRVGMIDSRKIVAINIDKNAPIFKLAHYQIIGDLNEVIPRLVKAVAS